MDDIHLAARAKEGDDGYDLPLEAARWLKSHMNSLASQADDRKYRWPDLRPGAWRGVIIHTDTPFPMMCTTAKKWGRFRDALSWVLKQGGPGSTIDTAELRRIAGLGVHLTEVYKYGRSFLKGFFNAIEAFRDDRDHEGWRLFEAAERVARLEDEDATRDDAQAGYPALTVITEELVIHTSALQRLFSSQAPLMVPIRPTDAKKLRYVIGDASAEGFAIATQYPNLHVDTKDGLWEQAFAERGSNLREAQNHVNHLLEEIEGRKHNGCELWEATDNAVLSAVWHKGMSTARNLFRVVLELKIKCYEHEVYLHIFHISGDRMIACGIDGASRGNDEAGVYVGHDMRDFLPLDRGAFDVWGGPLQDWCKSWMGVDYSPPLKPVEWFREGHWPGIHVWAPPPGAALTALKQLARSRQKRPERVSHVFICQRLLWDEEWRSRFEKEMDIWFLLQPGKFWPSSHFEPLLVGLSFNMSNRSHDGGGPWLVRQHREEVVEIGRALSTLSKTCHVQVGNYLSKLWDNPRLLPKVQGGLVRKVLPSP